MDADQRKKKRKLFDVLEEEESETEEAKMEKFYELIRVSKDIRARMMKINGERLKLEEEKSTEVMNMIQNTTNNNNNMKKMKMMMKNVEREKSTVEGGTWNTTFQLEDFLEDGFKFHVNFPAFPAKISGTVAALSSNFKKQEEKAADDGEGREDHSNNNNGLDLNLSL